MADSPARTFVAENNRTAGHLHVLLITTGSVASVKAPLIVAELLQVSQFLLSSYRVFPELSMRCSTPM
jgi:phosphopantothenoylcysteine decarboxylase